MSQGAGSMPQSNDAYSSSQTRLSPTNDLESQSPNPSVFNAFPSSSQRPLLSNTGPSLDAPRSQTPDEPVSQSRRHSSNHLLNGSGLAPIPSRYGDCRMCGLVEEVRKVWVFKGKCRMRDVGDDKEGPNAYDTAGEQVGPSNYTSQPLVNDLDPISNKTGVSSDISQNDRERDRRITVDGREILYHDDEITIYPAEGKEKLCDGGKHLIVVVNRHLERVYDFSPSDIPLLSNTLDTARSLLNPTSSKELDFRIGFVGTLLRDPRSPCPHLHAHAFLGPFDPSLPGATFYRRNVIFGWANWWSIEDLRAEIREETSNNRIKSGYSKRGAAPIDQVPNAGSRSGLPNALE